jgi:hypothetical protein
MLLAAAALGAILAPAATLSAQAPAARPRVFVDCRSCSDEFLRTEITFVDYVRDRHDADVHLHDPAKNRLDLSGDMSLRLVQGLSLRFSAEASRVRDQLTLARREVTAEEVLLRIRQLSTGYSFFAAGGLSYSFGSIYSHVVNPRMGN